MRGERREGKRGICSSDWSVALQDPLLDMEDVEEDFDMEDALFFVCLGFLNLETISWTSITIYCKLYVLIAFHRDMWTF